MEGSSKKVKGHAQKKREKEVQPVIEKSSTGKKKENKEKNSNEIMQKRVAKEKNIPQEYQSEKKKKKKQPSPEIVQEQIMETSNEKESKVPKEKSNKKRKVPEGIEVSNDEDQVKSLKKKIRAENPLYDRPLVEVCFACSLFDHQVLIF